MLGAVGLKLVNGQAAKITITDPGVWTLQMVALTITSRSAAAAIAILPLTTRHVGR
jgi:hypothetical protein